MRNVQDPLAEVSAQPPDPHPRLLARARTVADLRRQEVLGHLTVAISGLDRICQAAQEVSSWTDQLHSFRARLERVDIGSNEGAVLMEMIRLFMNKIEASLNAFADAIDSRHADVTTNQ